MVRCVVARDVLQWVPRECISAVVIYRFDGRKCEEKDGLTDSTTCEKVSYSAS